MAKLKRGLLLVGLFAALVLLFPLTGSTEVRVDVRIAPPPPHRFGGPPPVIVIPGTYVYMVPDIDADILFFSGYWYRPYEGHWFRSRSYGGPWAFCPDPRIPRAVLELPPDYRRIPPGHRRIPYGQFKKSWAGWERDRYWDRDPEWREGRHGRPEERHEGRGHFEGGPPEEHGRGMEQGERGRGMERGHGRGRE